jgi:hypothetical protein
VGENDGIRRKSRLDRDAGSGQIDPVWLAPSRAAAMLRLSTGLSFPILMNEACSRHDCETV